MIKFEYSTRAEKERIINENIHLLLLEEQRLFEGNFLIFGTKEESELYKTVYVDVPKKDIDTIQLDITEIAETTALVLEDTTTITETTATQAEDSTATAETLAFALIEIESLKSEIATLKGV